MARASGPVVLVSDPKARAQGLRRVPLEENGIFDERWIRDLVADHPDVIGIDSLAPSSGQPVTIGYEFESGAGSIDVLLCDPRGLLTIVQTRIWRNNEMRRTVVTQILDRAKELRHFTYAALDAEVRRTMSRRSNDPRGLWERIRQGVTTTEPEFIGNVQRCLSSGEFPLLIVGDGVKEGADELLSTIRGAPGLLHTLKLVELGCYHLDQEKDWPLVVAPNVIAQTAEPVRAVVQVETRPADGVHTEVQVAVAPLDVEAHAPAAGTAGATGGSRWDQTTFLAELTRTRGAAEAAVVRRVYRWAQEGGLRIQWGEGTRQGKFFLVCDHNGVEYRTFDISGSGWAGVNLSKLRNTPAFADEAVRKALVERLNQIEGVRISLDRADLNPCVSLKHLADPAGLDRFLKTLDWMVEIVKKSGK